MQTIKFIINCLILRRQREQHLEVSSSLTNTQKQPIFPWCYDSQN
jgi:hypothetical protein